MICRYDNGNCLCKTCVNNPIDNLRSACRDCKECRQAGHRKHNIGLCSDYKPMVETKRLKNRAKIVIELTEDEAETLCDFMEDEQNNGEYEHYWSANQREALDEVLYKLKCGLKDG